MIGSHSVLAVVPARSGSRGIPGKNMRVVGGMTLIARAGEVLQRCATVDARMISTDSTEYSEEGARHGLEGWFVRPAELSTDTATAVDTVTHALHESERHFGRTFEVIVIVEPTSPLRHAEDIDGCVRLLVEQNAQSVVAVSRVDSKFNPRKLLKVESGQLRYYDDAGAKITARQQLDGGLFYRNGVCYALRRTTLLEQREIFGTRALPYIVERPTINIDEPFELELAEFMLSRQGSTF